MLYLACCSPVVGFCCSLAVALMASPTQVSVQLPPPPNSEVFNLDVHAHHSCGVGTDGEGTGPYHRTLRVCPDRGRCDFTHIAAALSVVRDHDVLLVESGAYSEPSIDPITSNNITIRYALPPSPLPGATR
jgi:hypothetical protein